MARSEMGGMALARLPLRFALWHRTQATTTFSSRTARAARCSPTRKARHAAPARWITAKPTRSSSARRIRAAVRPTRTPAHRTCHHASPITRRTRVSPPSPFPRAQTASGWRAA
eukprot:scaffold80424_cov42-Phaeocystis_antarctica.AAC.1